MTDYLDDIARFAAETRLDDIPPEAVEAGKWIVLDTIGGMLAGSTLPEVREFAKLAAQRSRGGDCTLVGFGQRANPLFAAMLNATSACSYETDEGNRLGGGHPAIHVVPPALAEAQADGASGQKLLESVIVAYEVMSRLAGGSPTRWPVHSHGTHGSPGAAAAVAHLRGHDSTAMRRLLNLAACMSPATTWQVCFQGGTVRNIFPAESCLLGMLAVDLDACGYTSMADGPAEMFGQVLGSGTYDTETVTRDLGRVWRVTTNYFKLHAACAITHPELDAITDILAARPLAAGDIAAIDVAAGGISGHMAYTDPTTMLGAKFSIPYSIAAAIVLGRTDIEAFRGPALEDTRIHELSRRVHVHIDPPISGRDPMAPPVTVTVTLHTGETLRGETRVVRGDAANPASHAELLAKFYFLAGQRCDTARARMIHDAVMSLERELDATALYSLLAFD